MGHRKGRGYPKVEQVKMVPPGNPLPRGPIKKDRPRRLKELGRTGPGQARKVGPKDLKGRKERDKPIWYGAYITNSNSLRDKSTNRDSI